MRCWSPPGNPKVDRILVRSKSLSTPDDNVLSPVPKTYDVCSGRTGTLVYIRWHFLLVGITIFRPLNFPPPPAPPGIALFFDFNLFSQSLRHSPSRTSYFSWLKVSRRFHRNVPLDLKYLTLPVSGTPNIIIK